MLHLLTNLKQARFIFYQSGARTLEKGSSQGGRINELRRRVVGTSGSPRGERPLNKEGFFPLLPRPSQTKSHDLGLFFLGSLSMLAACILKGHQGPPSRVYAEDDGVPRGENLERLPSNTLRQTPKDLGLIEDKTHPGWYKLNTPNRFNVEVTPEHQFLWKSFCEVSASDVRGIARTYENLRKKRSLHINTGTHGSPDGTPLPGNKLGSANFFLEDLNAFKRYTWVSFHTVSTLRPPITYEEIRRKLKKEVDVLDAWCFSAKTKPRSECSDEEWKKEAERINEGSIRQGEFLGQFFSLNYESKIKPDTKYVDPVKVLRGRRSIILSKEVRDKLNMLAFCYLKGIGGMGKSRFALDTQECIKAGDNTYSNVIFISLKTANDRRDFLNYVKKRVGGPDKDRMLEEEILERYFTIISRWMERTGKKCLVIIDNVDTDNNLTSLGQFYNVLENVRGPAGPSKLDLLVTGRRELKSFLGGAGLSSNSATIELSSYHSPSNAWNIFLANFLKMQGDNKNKRDAAETAVTKKRSELEEIFRKSENHIGFIVNIARILGDVSHFRPLGTRLRSVSALIKEAIDEAQQNGYPPLREMLKVPLKTLDETTTDVGDLIYKKKATPLFEILALISDGPIRYEFLEPILEKCIEKGDTGLEDSSIFLAQKLIRKFEDYSLIVRTGDPKEFSFAMHQFYNVIMRHNLSADYSRNTKNARNRINSIIDEILDVITSNLGKENVSKEAVDENIRHLLSLFDYANDLENHGEMYERVSKEATSAVREKWKHIRYSDMTRIKKFFTTVSAMPGYSLERTLHRFVNNKEEEKGDLLRKLKEESFSLPLLKQANNFWVLYRDEDVQYALGSYIRRSSAKKFHPDYSTIKIAKDNIKNKHKKQSDQLIFPELEFHPIPETDRQRAEVWKQEHLRSGNKEVAKLKGVELKEGLRSLFHYLLEERGVKEIDLSYNSLGHQNFGIEAVRDLLKYQGSLETLKLNNNSLYRDDSFLEVLEGLKRNTTLKTLVLNNNSLGDKHIEELCRILKSHPKIEHIQLHHNQFTQNGIDLLEDLIKEKKNIKKITTYCYCSLWRYHSTGELKRDEKGGPYKKVIYSRL